jgi:hypothetical protein
MGGVFSFFVGDFMARHSLNKIHADRLKEIRTYIKFNYDLRQNLSPYQKRKIKKYHDALATVLARPGDVQIHRPRRADHIKIAARAVNLPGSLTELRAVPLVNPEAVKVSYGKKTAKFKSEHITKEFFPMDARKVIENPAREVEKLRKAFPRAKRYALGSNAFETQNMATPGQLLKFINLQLNTYKTSFGEWFSGVYVYTFTKQAGLDTYKKREAEAKEKRTRTSAAKRAKARRAKNK